VEPHCLRHGAHKLSAAQPWLESGILRYMRLSVTRSPRALYEGRSTNFERLICFFIGQSKTCSQESFCTALSRRINREVSTVSAYFSLNRRGTLKAKF
jgi:hypothetical protein